MYPSEPIFVPSPHPKVSVKLIIVGFLYIEISDIDFLLNIIFMYSGTRMRMMELCYRHWCGAEDWKGM